MEVTSVEIEGIKKKSSILPTQQSRWLEKKLVDPHALVRNFPVAYLDMENRARASVF